MWILQGPVDDAPVLTFRVNPGSMKTMGRASRADFIVKAALVSRLHCRLEANGEKLEVIDLSSTNGTFVNERRVERANLSSGDRLRIGRLELQVGREERPSSAMGEG